MRSVEFSPSQRADRAEVVAAVAEAVDVEEAEAAAGAVAKYC